ncbi:MAG TPA: DUF934 domain-containing protein [Solimonas sp.]
MSALIRDRVVVADDAVTLADDAPLPATGTIIVSWTRWQAEQAALRASDLRVGVQIPNTLDVEAVGAELQDRPLIVLSFPAFGDGRAYSQARLLRERHNYRGEIRASGAAVVRDQLAGMWRSGINAFALRADQDAQLCLGAFEDFSTAYQPALDDTLPVFLRRRRETA